MGWSTEGLRAMAELRAYVSSGGKVTQEHIHGNGDRCNHKDYESIEAEATSEARSAFSFMDERPSYLTILRLGKVTPMYDCLKGICYGGFHA